MSILRRIQSGDQSANPAPNQQPANPGGPMQPGAPSMGGQMQQRRIISNAGQSSQDTYQDLKTRVQNKLLSEIDPSVDVTKVSEVRKTIQDLFE